MDNTDPNGFERVLAQLNGNLGHTLCIVISKSGGTKETRNAMLKVEAAYHAANIPFGPHALAITSDGSELGKHAENGKWMKTFPMWDWIGGRTSVLSAVGLLPAALQGFNIDALLQGASNADNVTRAEKVADNPAVQLALFVHYIGKGLGEKAMVVLPYRDSLELFSRYLQQLVMESLGKGADRNGGAISQGLTVFGNKGSTDQHAYVQQLRDGLANFFALFIWVIEDQERQPLEVEPQITSGDYLTGFLLGTREALFERGRESVLMSLERVDEFHVGALIALFERFVGYYATLINVNAYHQPGVEAGKKAATRVIELQRSALAFLAKDRGNHFSVAEIATSIGAMDSLDTVFRICQHLAINGRISGKESEEPAEAEFGLI
jgi:glucose-6-phosphate isomerase